MCRHGESRIDNDEFDNGKSKCRTRSGQGRHHHDAEGIEIWEAGDPEGARDALRYALGGCGDNLWVHVALGKIALEAFNDPELARGHFGYAFELANRALPRDFRGRLSRSNAKNAPIFDSVDP